MTASIVSLPLRAAMRRAGRAGRKRRCCFSRRRALEWSGGVPRGRHLWTTLFSL